MSLKEKLQDLGYVAKKDNENLFVKGVKHIEIDDDNIIDRYIKTTDKVYTQKNIDNVQIEFNNLIKDVRICYK